MINLFIVCLLLLLFKLFIVFFEIFEIGMLICDIVFVGVIGWIIVGGGGFSLFVFLGLLWGCGLFVIVILCREELVLR